MVKIQYTKNRKGFLYLILVLFIVLISFFSRITNLTAPLLDAHYFRQTQTATVARNFFVDGVDFLHTRIDIFGVEESQILLLEFPFYQATVAVISHLTGFSDSIGRLISIFFAISSGVVLMLLIYRLFKDKNIALSAFVFFLFAPLNIFFQQTFMIESTVVGLHIFSLYAWIRYLEDQTNRWYICALLLTILAFLQKSVYAPFLAFPILFLGLSRDSKHFKVKTILALTFAGLILIAWSLYVDQTNTLNGNSYFTSSNQGFRLWHFGTLLERFSLDIWKTRINAINGYITKLFLLAFLAGLGYLLRNFHKKYLFLLVWLISMISYYLIFFRIQSHDYYFMIILPVISIIASIGLVSFANFMSLLLAKIYNKRLIFYSIIFLYLLVFSVKGYKNSKPYFSLDYNLRDDINIMKKELKENGNVIFVFDEYDWNSVYTYYLQRKGLAFAKINFNPNVLPKYQEQGYKYIIFYGVSGDEEISRSILSNEKSSLLHKEKGIKIYKI